MSEPVTRLRESFDGLAAHEILTRAVAVFGDRVALATSLGAEDQVLTDMLCSITSAPRIFTLDTGRLPDQTHDTLEQTNARYGIRIKVLFPAPADVEAMVNDAGPNLFRDSVEGRKRCCYVRKVLPLRRELATLEAWITGLRREQSPTREAVQAVQWDQANGLIKLNPLAEWTNEDVWDYVRRHHVPTNPLHEQGYPSIGCAPCTRAVAPGEDIRAGRWWWECPQHKECGLHRSGSTRQKPG